MGSSAGSRDAALGLPGHAAAVRAVQGDVVVLPGRGLQLAPQLSFARWVEVGRQLSDIHTSSAWCLGDWLVYGEAVYERRYRAAVERTSLDYQTLRNYAWVARRFPLSRRRDSLSFAHHAEVAAMPEAEQDYWLRKAEQAGWPVKRLRRVVRASLIERGGDGPPATAGPENDATPAGRAEPPAAMVTLQVRLTPGELVTCQTAAGRAGQSVQDWAAATLHHAAATDSTTPHHLRIRWRALPASRQG